MEKLLKEISVISENVITALRKDDIDKCKMLVEERSKIIQKIQKNFNEQKVNLEDYNLISLNECINSEISQAKFRVKQEMYKLENERKASSIYEKRFESIYFINKQI